MDQELINESAERIKEIILENIETADVRKGSVLREIFVQAGASVRSALQEQIDNFEKTNSLKAIEENPADTSDAAVDAIVSNWSTTRKLGTIALGTIKLDVTTQKQYFIPTNVAFTTANGLNYFAVSATTIEAEDLFQDEVSGTFYFLVSVQAEAAGSEYEIEAGTQLQTNILSGSLILVSAYNDFFNGKDDETSTDLIARGKTAISTRDLVSRTSINAFFQENFSDIFMSSVTGFQDREMQRGVNTIGVKSAGPVDIYIKTDSSVNSKEIETTTDANGLFSVPIENSPILRVKDFALKSNPEERFEVEDLLVSSQNNLAPKFARFSQFESIQVQTDQISKNIIYTINIHPNIKAVDDFINGDTRENLCTATIVKTFVPVFVSTTIKFSVKDATDVPTNDDIRIAICNFINSIDSGQLYVSQMIDIFHNFNIVNIELPLSVTGKMYKPDGTVETKTSSNKLSFDDQISLQISQNTYRFYCVKSDIALERSVI